MVVVETILLTIERLYDKSLVDVDIQAAVLKSELTNKKDASQTPDRIPIRVEFEIS